MRRRLYPPIMIWYATINSAYGLATLLNCAQNPSEIPSQDVLSEQPLVNGASEKNDIKQDGEHVEPNINSAEVSVSGGSDTEASKAEASKSQVDEKGHVRTTSTVKKFASFKPVSVNKTFLAAKGSNAATTAKVGDKVASGATAVQTGPSSTSSALRPRLVAKTGSGLRDSAPRAATSANGGKAGAAPDASAVWNKNRRTLHFLYILGKPSLTVG